MQGSRHEVPLPRRHSQGSLCHFDYGAVSWSSSQSSSVHIAQGALPLCTTQQCDVTGKFQESIGAAKALCVALRLEHAHLLQVHFCLKLGLQ
jgi:hypothetical protein